VTPEPPGRSDRGPQSDGRRGPYRKGRQKRQDILHAAVDVFSRNGYRNASIREIAASVNLTPAGLLHYFPTKEELFVEVLRVRDLRDEAEGHDIIEAARLAIQHNVEVDGLVHLFVTVSAEAIESSHPGHGYFRSRYEHLICLLREHIVAGQDDGTVTQAVDADMAARLFIAVMDGMQVQWLLDSDHTDMLAALDSFWRLLLVVRGRSDDDR
jgi:AcrR family transcriptional regulator